MTSILKNRAGKIILFFLVSFLIPTAYAPPLLAQQPGPQELQDVQQIVAVVNDKPISLYDLKQRVRLFIMTSGNRQMAAREQQYLNQQALQSLIDDKLKIQEAQKYRANASLQEQEQSFTAYAQQMRLSPTQLEQQLNRAGVRKEAMLKQIAASLAWEKLVGGLLMPQVNISDEEVNLILDRMNNNKGAEEYHPLEIFLLVSENDKRDETRAAAEKIVAQLREKTPFQIMARQFSQSTTSAVGGDLGWLMRSQLNPEIAVVLENMESGDISEPVETEDGFYILQLAGKRKILAVTETDTKVDLQHMFFAVAKDISEDARTALVKKITDGAAQVKSCDALAEQGKALGATETGSLGNLAVGELPPNLHQPILALDVGEASAPVAEPNGYRVFVVCGKQVPEIRMPDYDSVENSLSQQRVGMIARRHLRDLRRNAIIDYK